MHSKTKNLKSSYVVEYEEIINQYLKKIIYTFLRRGEVYLFLLYAKSGINLFLSFTYYYKYLNIFELLYLTFITHDILKVMKHHCCKSSKIK